MIFDNLARNSLKDKAIKDHPNLKLIQGDVLKNLSAWRRLCAEPTSW